MADIEQRLRSTLSSLETSPARNEDWDALHRRLHRRHRHGGRLVGLAALTILVVAAVVIPLRSGGDGAEVVRRIATTAEARGSYRAVIETEMRFEGPDTQFLSRFGGRQRIEGAIDLHRGIGRYVWTIKPPEGSGTPPLRPCTFIVAGDVGYLEIPEKYRSHFDGKRWLRDEGPYSPTAAVAFPPVGPFSDPADLIDLLGGLEELEEVGEEVVRDTPAVRYRGELDLRRVVETLPAEQREAARRGYEESGVRRLPVEIWVDDEGLLRRFVATLEAEQGGMTSTLQTTGDLFDYGADLRVSEPPLEEVTRLSDPNDVAVCLGAPPEGVEEPGSG